MNTKRLIVDLNRENDRGVDRSKNIRFDRNERTKPFTDKIFKEILSLMTSEDLVSYPDQNPLYNCLSKFLGLDTNNIYIERAGNLPNLKTSEAKKLIINNYLKSYQYKKAYLFDDSLENILSFAELKSRFTDIKFHPTLVR